MKNTDGKRNWERWSKTRCFQSNKMAKVSDKDGHEVCGRLYPGINTHENDDV